MRIHRIKAAPQARTVDQHTGTIACPNCARLQIENEALREELDATISDILELLRRIDEITDTHGDTP